MEKLHKLKHRADMRVTTWTGTVGGQRQKPVEEQLVKRGDFSQLPGAAPMDTIKKLTSLHQHVTRTNNDRCFFTSVEFQTGRTVK